MIMKENKVLTPEARLLLLVIIEKDGSVDDLHNLGYEYFQITRFLKDEIENKYAVIDNGHLMLTEKGKEEQLLLKKRLNVDKTNKVVLPQLADREIKILNSFDVFIPSEDDLMF